MQLGMYRPKLQNLNLSILTLRHKYVARAFIIKKILNIFLFAHLFGYPYIDYTTLQKVFFHA